MPEHQAVHGLRLQSAVLLLLGSVVVPSGAAKSEGEPSPAPARPFQLEKAPREHTEHVSAAPHAYEIEMGGTLDEFNTADYPPTYGGSMRLESKVQPNAYVVIENVGGVDVVDPWLVVNGRRSWFSADDILGSILTPGMTDAEKAMAIWRFTSSFEVQAHDNNRRVGPPFPAVGSETDNRERSHPSQNTFQERANPVKAANCYYCSGCSLSAANFVVLCHSAGLTARAVWMSALNTYRNHCVGEVWYDGGWHLFDPERRAFFLEADNTTIASYETVHRTPSLDSRTHCGGFPSKGMKPHAAEYEKYYPPHVMPVEQWLSTMSITLRPGEKLVFRWAHDGKYRYGHNVRKRGHLVPYHLANGKLIYRPCLSGSAFWRGTISAQNIRWAELQGGQGVQLHPEVVRAPGGKKEVIEAPPGSVVYRVSSPYPIVGGLVGGEFYRKTAADACRICVAVRDSDWSEVWSADGIGPTERYVAIDKVLDPRPTPAIYTYYVRFEVDASAAPTDASMTGLYIETDLQMAATALPSLSVGANKVVYRDRSGPDRRVRITHGRRESAATRPPLPPDKPVTPANGATASLGKLNTLKWEAAKDPDGGSIADYHIQVCPRPDMLHPVSPNFDRLVFSGTPQWEVPEGWLVEGRTYCWRVRARDDWGAWSGWSRVWKFRCAP